MLKALAFLLSVVSISTAGPTLKVDVPNAAPPPPGFNITSLGVLGTGCPPNTTYWVLSPDRTAVTVTFSEFYAEAGPTVPISANRKACQLTFGVAVPPGFTFAVATVDYRGFYQLDEKVTASQQSIYYFQGELIQSTARSEHVGPVEGADYTYRDEFELHSTVQSPCGIETVLNINSDIRVNNANNPQGTGLFATDSIDPSLATTFNFQWQTCTTPPKP